MSALGNPRLLERLSTQLDELGGYQAIEEASAIVYHPAVSHVHMTGGKVDAT